MKVHIVAVSFVNYKAFANFILHLREFNVLVGPNNAGKSTIIGAFRLLSEGIRMAKKYKASIVQGVSRMDVWGYKLDLTELEISTENIFHNYDDSQNAIIKFSLSNGGQLVLNFPEKDVCYFYHESKSKICTSPKNYAKLIGVEVGFVPILGPVDRFERLYLKEAARVALLSAKASRNFRNIWYHYGEDFEEFKEIVQKTWPGMDIQRPTPILGEKGTFLTMFCPEERIDREIYWSGFGFQIWCQLLTWIIKNKSASLFLVDEPDIYLHSTLQRQLIDILRKLGPDVLIATHSTEMLAESELSEILLVDKKKKSGNRVRDVVGLVSTFQALGSTLNPVLTQIAKTRRVLFVEGNDFSIISKFARLLGYHGVANQEGFAVFPTNGFRPSGQSDIKSGIEGTIGAEILSFVIFDRDYRCDQEVESIEISLNKANWFSYIYTCKEIENFLLNPTALDKALRTRMHEIEKRSGRVFNNVINVEKILEELTHSFKAMTLAQRQSFLEKYVKPESSKLDKSTVLMGEIQRMDETWNKLDTRLKIIPGKEVLAAFNSYLEKEFGLSLTKNMIIEGFGKNTVSLEMATLLAKLDEFRTT